MTLALRLSGGPTVRERTRHRPRRGAGAGDLTRRGWDLNPRTSYPVTSLAGRPDQPDSGTSPNAPERTQRTLDRSPDGASDKRCRTGWGPRSPAASPCDGSLATKKPSGRRRPPAPEFWARYPSSAAFSYSVNCWGGGLEALLVDVDWYRPRHVALDLVAMAGASVADASPGLARRRTPTPPEIAAACASDRPIGSWRTQACPSHRRIVVRNRRRFTG